MGGGQTAFPAFCAGMFMRNVGCSVALESHAEEKDRWSVAQHQEYAMLDVAKGFLLRIHCDPANETLADSLWHFVSQ